MVSSTISVSSTPTKTCSLFLRVKTFIFFSLSLFSITFCSFFFFLFLFLIGAWFSHSLLHEKDTLLCLLGQRASECCLKSQKLSWDGIIQVSHRSCYRYYGNSQVLPSLIHYIQVGSCLCKHQAGSQVLGNRGTGFGYQLKRIAVTSMELYMAQVLTGIK